MPTQSEISLSPISAKGDILTTDGSSRTRVAVGTNGQILTARSSATSGVQFENGGGSAAPTFILISSTTTTAAVDTVTISFSSNTNVALYYVTGALRNTRTDTSESGIYPNDYTTGYAHYSLNHYGTVSPLTMSFDSQADGSPGSLMIITAPYSGATLHDANSYSSFEYYVTNGAAAATSQATLRTLMLGTHGMAFTGNTTGTLYGRSYNSILCATGTNQTSLTSIVLRDGNPAGSDIAIGSIIRVYEIRKS